MSRLTTFPPVPPGHTPDSVRSWVDQARANTGLIQPYLMLRTATDSNYISEQVVGNTTYGGFIISKAMMNAGTPGQRVPGTLTWSTTESIDSVANTAQFEALNALPVSKTTKTLQDFIPARKFNTDILHTWVLNGNLLPVDLGNVVVGTVTDPVTGSRYLEENVLYRIFQNEAITCNNLDGFPDPRVPYGETDTTDPTQSYWPSSSTGVGAYYILVGNEVMRVISTSGSSLLVPPGGRGVNGVIADHSPGESVTLLGFAPYTGRWTGVGFSSPKDFEPYTSYLRPGTCLVSYEGYGTPPTRLNKNNNPGENIQFTGYWFVKGSESNLADDGVPRITCNLVSPGYIFTEQKITLDTLLRSQNQFASWAQAAFDDVGHLRHIPGDWVDYNSWDPSLPGSYPLKIAIQLSQHKDFFDHMSQTTFGKECAVCQDEWRAYVDAGNVPGRDPIADARVVGKHIYHESIRVFDNGQGGSGAGPVKTYIRLMLALAIGAWENPLVGNALGQRWTKMPNDLFNRLLNPSNGRCWAGQLGFGFATGSGLTNDTFPWDNQAFEEVDIVGQIRQLECPFSATYDKQDFTQPALDLADVNRMTFYITRGGDICFAPKGFKLVGYNFAISDWWMSYGESISNYSHNLDIDQVNTLVYVQCQSAFDTDFSLGCAGTTFKLDGGPDDGKLIWYSNRVGNVEGLALTGGVQTVDTISLDNLSLGFTWNTNPAGWGVQVVRNGVTEELIPFPHFPSGNPVLSQSSQSNPTAQVIEVQKFVNFLLLRFYINAYPTPGSPGTYTQSLNLDGKYGANTAEGVRQAQIFLNIHGTNAQDGNWAHTNPAYYGNSLSADGIWGPKTYKWAVAWSKTEMPTIKTDVWWYAQAGYDWNYYVCAIIGIPVPEILDTSQDSTSSIWQIDLLALQKEQVNIMKKFLYQATTVGNSAVDESINKASVRQIQSNIADPRVQIGDVSWVEVPGLSTAVNEFGSIKAPFKNGVYITEITRNIDMQAGTYSATYSGYRYRPAYDNLLLVPTNYIND